MNIQIIEDLTRLTKAEITYRVELDIDEKHQLTYDLIKIVDVSVPEDHFQNSIIEVSNVNSDVTDINELTEIISAGKQYIEEHESEIIEMVREK